MRYASIRSMDISNGEGIGIALFVQGCPIRCPGCFNPETWNFNSGKQVTEKIKTKLYQLMKPNYIIRCSILGGEPLVEENLYELNSILCTIKTNWPDKKIWIWTGYTWEELQERQKKLRGLPNLLYVTFKYTDYLVAGPFIQEEKDLTLKWRGSRNQEIIDIQKTLKEGKKILYEN